MKLPPAAPKLYSAPLLALFLCTAAIAALLSGCSGGPQVDAVDLPQELLQVRARLATDHPGRGVIDYPGNPVADIPKSYAMVLLAELARKTHPSTLDLPDMGLVAGYWLLEHADENADGIVGWGLPVAWDAYGDGSENPANTEYSISTAIAVHALLDWMQASPAAPADRIRDVVGRALRPYVEGTERMRSASGLLPYSLREVDRKYDTFNPAAYLAGQMQRFSTLTADVALARELRSAADATMHALLQHRLVSPETGNWYWKYSIQEQHPNDFTHAAYIVAGIQAYVAHGGSLAAEFDIDKVFLHLSEFTADKGLNGWPRFWKPLQRPARLYDLGMALHVVCSEPRLRHLREPILAGVKAYRSTAGYLKYPRSFDESAITINEYEAYLYRGLATCLSGLTAAAASGEHRDPRQRALAITSQRHLEAMAAIKRRSEGTRNDVPFVDLSDGTQRVVVRFHASSRVSRISIDRGPELELPRNGLPIALLAEPDGAAVVFRTMPDNRLFIAFVDPAGRMGEATEIVHSGESRPLFRSARYFSGAVHLVYYDNPTLANYHLQMTRSGVRYVAASKPLRLPLLGDPAGGTYEMVPAVFLLPQGEELHIIGGTLHARLTPRGLLHEARLESCLRAIEATATDKGPVVLCVKPTRRAGTSQFVLVGALKPAVQEVDTQPGVPWNLRFEDGRVVFDSARGTDALRAMLLRDLHRAQQGGWLEFGTNNDEGRIPWAQIYYLNGFLDLLLLARHDEGMLELLQPLLGDIGRRLDLEMALLDWHWREGRYRTRAFTTDRSPALFAVQTARLLLLMERYLREVPSPIALSSYEDVRRAVHELRGHIEVLATAGEPERWIQPGRSHLRWPRGSKFSFDGTPVPFNHQNEWAYAILATQPARQAGHRAALDIIEHFIERIAPGGHLPGSGEWDYWWGTAHDGWTESDAVSVNRPSYAGDKIKAWISFRSIDVMSALYAARWLPKEVSYRLLESSLTLVYRGQLYPFVSYELFRHGYAPTLSRDVAESYVRVSSPWEIQNAAWALLRYSAEEPK